MRYVKPHYYDAFCCIADQCPDTCCAGWQIVIDEESLEEYSRVEGPFGGRLHASIDWREGIFRQKKGRCFFLNEANLCDLYGELGEKALCKTCSMYPRHVEEFEGLRELSLSLSCPVAAEMILTCREPLLLLCEETDEREELEEEFEEFDLLLFTQLQDARAAMFAVLQDRHIPVEKRIRQAVALSERIQQCIDEERYCDVDDVIRQCREAFCTGAVCRPGDGETCGDEQTCCGRKLCPDKESCYDRMCREYQVFGRLERLRDEWSDVLLEAWDNLYAQGKDAYDEICREFDRCFGGNSRFSEQWSLFAENLMLFFIYTYFCGAVYDDWVYSKAAFGEFSVRWIRELVMSGWVTKTRQIAPNGVSGEEEVSFDWKLCIETAYRYAREIEHSDCNLNMLEEWLWNEWEGRLAVEKIVDGRS